MSILLISRIRQNVAFIIYLSIYRMFIDGKFRGFSYRVDDLKDGAANPINLVIFSKNAWNWTTKIKERDLGARSVRSATVYAH